MEVVKRKPSAEGCSGDKVLTAQKGSSLFRDNLEYLEALAFEAKVWLAVAHLRKKNSSSPVSGGKDSLNPEGNKSNVPEKKDFLFPDLFPGEVTLSQMEAFLKKVSEENKRRAEDSLLQGIDLPFEHFCSSFGLDPFERRVAMFLTANNLGKGGGDFSNRLWEGGWHSPNGGIAIGVLLDIISPGFREKFVNRKYFSRGGTLIKEEIVSLAGATMNMGASSILDMTVLLNDWALRYILGDRNTYDNSSMFITRDWKPIAWERVILAQGIKDEILKLAENYSRRKDRVREAALSQFYGYGKGLTFLFSGPSGTGKTMLAHALANRLNKDLLSINLGVIYSRMDLTFEDAIRYIFREAKLGEGIVFFDECDDIFIEESSASRALLIEIEKADCITILATNEIEKLDPALDRRIIMQVPFYLPDEVQREQIWKTSVPPGLVLSQEVDFKHLAQKYFFSGGLIKNTLIMSIQNGIHHNGGPTILLTQEELEKTADWQTNRMLGTKGIETVYQPQVRLEEVPIRSQDKKWFHRLASLYKKTRGENNSGLSFVVGSSDIQTGISCIEGVAAACHLKVKRFPFSEVIFNKYGSVTIDKRSHRREINLLEYAFKFSPGQDTLLLFIDPQAAFERLLEEKEEKEGSTLFKFQNQLRSFRGLFFLVTKPIRKSSLPVEIHHYIELKPPLEDLQLKRWEAHLKDEGYSQEELLDLIERHPMYLQEIDAVARRAKINALLQGDEASLNLKHIYEAIGRLKNKKEAPILFGPDSSFHKK